MMTQVRPIRRRGLDPVAAPCQDRVVERAGEKLLAFRKRFEGVEDADRADADRDAPTRELRLLCALQLHDVAVALEIARARMKLGPAPDEEILAEVNRSWVDTAPIPVSLGERWRTIRGDRAR